MSAPKTCRGAVPLAKMEAASGITGGALRNYTEARSVCQGRSDEHHRDTDRDAVRPARNGPMRGATTRRCSSRRARGVRRGRRIDLAGGDRAPRRRRNRDALPPLPQAPGAAGGALRRRGRRGLPLSRRARGRRSVGGARRLVRTSDRLRRDQAGARARAAQLSRPRCAAVPELPRLAVSPRASHCSSAPRRPASCAPTSNSPRSSRW